MKDIIKEYKTQIAIIIGALIIAFGYYYTNTTGYREWIKSCIDGQKWKYQNSKITKDDLKSFKDYCHDYYYTFMNK